MKIRTLILLALILLLVHQPPLSTRAGVPISCSSVTYSNPHKSDLLSTLFSFDSVNRVLICRLDSARAVNCKKLSVLKTQQLKLKLLNTEQWVENQ